MADMMWMQMQLQEVARTLNKVKTTDVPHLEQPVVKVKTAIEEFLSAIENGPKKG